MKKEITLEEKWVWTTGYKGTDSQMCGHGGYQYELGKQFDMPEGEKIEICESGFHFCLKLEDVFTHYSIGDKHRFFKVNALVRMDDLAKYGATGNPLIVGSWALGGNKLVAKSIIFERELSPDEIIVGDQYQDYTEAEKIAALEHSPWFVTMSRQIRTLEECGYSRPLAEYIVHKTKHYDLAYALGSQPELDMTAKILLIFDNGDKITVPAFANGIYPRDLYAQVVGSGRGL